MHRGNRSVVCRVGGATIEFHVARESLCDLLRLHIKAWTQPPQVIKHGCEIPVKWRFEWENHLQIGEPLPCLITSGCMLNTEEIIESFRYVPRLCAHQPFAVVTVYSFHHFFLRGDGVELPIRSESEHGISSRVATKSHRLSMTSIQFG